MLKPVDKDQVNRRAYGQKGLLQGDVVTGACLDRNSIQDCLTLTPPLIEQYLNLDEQLQPNGFDLTVKNLERFDGPDAKPGMLPNQSEGRILPPTYQIAFGSDGIIHLAPGSYLVTFNEIVNFPLDLMGLAKPRSSLLRSGVTIHTAVWDAGYRGRSQALMEVLHPLGFTFTRNARLIQMVFFRLEQRLTQGYSGVFQGEGIEDHA